MTLGRPSDTVACFYVQLMLKSSFAGLATKFVSLLAHHMLTMSPSSDCALDAQTLAKHLRISCMILLGLVLKLTLAAAVSHADTMLDTMRTLATLHIVKSSYINSHSSAPFSSHRHQITNLQHGSSACGNHVYNRRSYSSFLTRGMYSCKCFGSMTFSRSLQPASLRAKGACWCPCRLPSFLILWVSCSKAPEALMTLGKLGSNHATILLQRRKGQKRGLTYCM